MVGFYYGHAGFGNEKRGHGPKGNSTARGARVAKIMNQIWLENQTRPGKECGMRTLLLVGLLLLILGDPLPLQAHWENANDNKSPIELAAMTNEQLFNEAFDVCVRRALLESLPNPAEDTPHAVAECNDYLNTMYPFVRERNGGKAPPWMRALLKAHTTKECQSAFRGFLGASDKVAAGGKGKRMKAARPHAAAPKRKATPAPPHSQWHDQLPPWIAP